MTAECWIQIDAEQMSFAVRRRDWTSHDCRPFVMVMMLIVLRIASGVAAEPDLSRPLPGQIVIDPERPAWLLRHGQRHLFICGPGDPEDFLYRGRRNDDGTRE